MCNSSEILNRTIVDKGYTTDLDGNKPDTGYMVGLEGFESTMPINRSIDDGIAFIDAFIFTNKEELNKPNRYLGTWINEGIIYIDISVNINLRKLAVTLGIKNNQIAIWDLSTKEEIIINK